MALFTKSINTISRCTMFYRGEKLAGAGLNGYQGTYILQICRQPGISQDALADAIYVHKSNVTRQLNLLEEHGFIRREISASDRRVTEVYPTDKAWEILPQVRQTLEEWNTYLTEDLSENEKAVFHEMLERVAQKAKRYVDEMKKE